ncbi:hypothetical protein [Nitrosomonas sp. Nm132]|uniref:hypothetical protein n=1 Tax=Nitrosomonas sp. Nm132 TaxID=1881053 RepID=UPI0008849633|nr:hypothetical protein [Nitrosomonas sp. Nm132]SDH27535.1 hypothetical protein SAMN05428952_100986 [Nitrosomonas sp. Nm132]
MKKWLFTMLMLYAFLSISMNSMASQIFEKEMCSVKIGFEFNKEGSALVVQNKSEKKISIKPEDIKISTGKIKHDVCTIHHISLFGIGSPLLDASVSAGESSGFVLSGCYPLGEKLAINKPVTFLAIGSFVILDVKAKSSHESAENLCQKLENQFLLDEKRETRKLKPRVQEGGFR